MSIGNSGRIVIELEPGLKRQIYSALAKDGLTLKEWFVREAQTYLNKKSKDQLDFESGVSNALVVRIDDCQDR